MTNLNVNLSSDLQTTLGQAGVWAYAVYFSGGAQFTTLVEDGAIQSDGSVAITLPDPFVGGKVYFIVQSQDSSQPYDLTALIDAEDDISWDNAGAWDFRYDSFEVTLQGSSADVGNLTEVNGFGLPMEVSVTYSDNSTSTLGYKIGGADLFDAIEAVGDPPTVFDYTDGPLSGPRMAVSPTEAIGNSPAIPAFEASDWDAYVDSLQTADPGIAIAGFFNGAKDSNGVWHDAGFFSYTLEWDATDEVFWLSAADNSEIQGYIQITPEDLADSIYATMGNVGVFASKDGEPYQILDHAAMGGDYSMNSGENNQWGKVLTYFLEGLAAGFFGTAGDPINPLVFDPVDLNKNWNWDPSYAFGENLAGAPEVFQDPYSSIFYHNSNSYGSNYADVLMAGYAQGGPQILVWDAGLNSNVSNIDITLFDDSETPTGYVTPVIYNYIDPGVDGFEWVNGATSANTVKLDFANGDMVLADDTPISLEIITGTINPGEYFFDVVEFTLPAGQSPWQAWQINQAGDGSYSAALQEGTPQGAGQLLITNFPTASDGVSWYKLNVGAGDDKKTFNFYVETSGGAFVNPAVSPGSIAVDGLALLSPQLSAAATIPTFTIDFAYIDSVAVDPDLFVRNPSLTQDSVAPNAPVAGTGSGDDFAAISGQTNQVSNSVETSDNEIAFAWTGLNTSTINTQSWISGYTNKVGGLNFAEINLVKNGQQLTPILTNGDVDSQWQTAPTHLSNGKYTVMMAEYLFADTTQAIQVGKSSSPLTLKVHARELDLAKAGGGGLELVPQGADDPSGNWIKLKALKSSAPPGTTVLLYAVDEDGEMVSRDGLESGASVTLEEATRATIGAILDDRGGLLVHGAQSVYLPADLQLRFALMKGDGVVNDDPRVKIVPLDDGSMRVKVGGVTLEGETDNSLSQKAMLAGAQRATDEPMLYLEHGATLDVDVFGSSDRKNTLGFVRIDIDAATGQWSVGGVAYGDTEAFKDAVRANLDDGFHFKRAGDFSVARSWTVDGETGYYAPVLLTKAGDAIVIGDANPGDRDYIRMFGENTFGFEDRTRQRGADFDFDDIVMQISPSTGAHADLLI